MFKIIYDLEKRFPRLEAAKAFCTFSQMLFVPTIPKHRMDSEDKTQPRICVAPTIEDCITAIGMDALFGGSDKAVDAYPVIVVKFDNDLDYYQPSKEEVPDVSYTHELWLKGSAKPSCMELLWLSPASVYMKHEGDHQICTKAEFLSTERLTDKVHPWLEENVVYTKDTTYLDQEDKGIDTEYALTLASQLSTADLLLIRMIQYSGGDVEEIETLKKLSQRCVEYFWTNDDPRFTPEDLADALLSVGFIDSLEETLESDDEEFAEKAAFAAETYRFKMCS